MTTSVNRNLELILTADADGGQSFEAHLRDRESGVTLGRRQSVCDLTALRAEFIERLRNHVGSALPEDMLQLFGRRLASILLPGELYPTVIDAIQSAGSDGSSIRIHLQCESRALADIPWEFVYLEPGQGNNRGGFLCRTPSVHLIRSVASRSALEPAQIGERLRVLVVCADPRTAEYPVLPHIREELRSIRAALGSPVCWNVDLEIVEAATRSRFQQALQDSRPHVLYFTGHGDAFDGGTLIVHQEGAQDPAISGSELADWLSGLPTRLVVLSACDSAGVARTLAERGVPAVIAMQIPLRATIAEAFARNLYSVLAQPAPVEEALSLARRYVEPESVPDWGAAVLYLNGDGAIFNRVASKSPFHVPRPSSIHFRGRRDLIEEIHRKLMTSVPVALAGMGGLGKTETCLQYAQRYQSYYEGGVFWIDARDADRTIQSLVEVGRLYFDVADKDSLAAQAAQTRRKLQECLRPFLLVYDNVNRAEDVSVLPVAGHCHALFTTRHPFAVEHLAHVVNVPLLEPESSLEVLQLFTQAQTDSELQAVEYIADALGRLPIALRLAASYIGQRQQSFADYAYHAARWEGLDPVYESIAISYRDMPPDTASVLCVAACFAGQAISPSLLFEACRRVRGKLTRDRFNESLLKLTAYSLVGRGQRADDEPEARLSMHQLVRDYAQRRLSRTRRDLAIEAIGEVLAPMLVEANKRESWVGIRREIPHCHAVAQLYRDGDAERGAIPMLRELGHYCHLHGELHLASKLFAEGLKQAEGRPPGPSVEAAIFRMKLGLIEQVEKRPVQALEYEKQALDMASGLLEPGDPRLADFYNCSGFVLKMQDQFDQALSYYQKACSLYEGAYTAICAELASFYNSISTTYRSMGQVELSIKVIKKALTIYEGAYCAIHAELASCYNNLGTTYESMGQPELSIEYIQKALAIDEALYAAEQPVGTGDATRHGSPKIAIRLNNLGRILGDRGDWAGALPIHERALAINASAFERRHPDVAASLYYTGRALAGVGRPEEGKLLLEESLAIYKHFFGPDHHRCEIVQNAILSVDLNNSSDRNG